MEHRNAVWREGDVAACPSWCMRNCEVEYLHKFRTDEGHRSQNTTLDEGYKNECH